MGLVPGISGIGAVHASCPSNWPGASHSFRAVMVEFEASSGKK